MDQIPNDLRGRVEAAKREGYRIQFKPERTRPGADSQWRPAVVVWVPQSGGAEVAQPLSSTQNLVFATREEANAHMLELALRWIEDDQSKRKRRVVAQVVTKEGLVLQAITYPEGNRWGWRVDKMMNTLGARPGETLVADTAASAEEAEECTRRALEDVLNTQVSDGPAAEGEPQTD